jgi:hypothetical protein
MDTTPSITELQKICEEGMIVPFRIIGVGEKGLSARVFNHKAFVSFLYMPFEYESMEVWKILLPSFKQAVFSAKISVVDIEKQFCILNASIPQFEPIQIEHQTAYSGIIIQKAKSYLLVEMGANFNWQYGSVLGFLPKSKRDRIIFYEDLTVGDSLSVSIYDYDESQRVNYLVQGSISSRDWDKHKIWDLLNEKVIAKVAYHGTEKIFVIEGKYKGLLDLSDKWYKKSKLRYAIKGMVHNLQEGEEIPVKVIRIKESSQTMEIVWIIDKKTEEMYLSTPRNTIADILGNTINLSTLKK